MNKKRAEIRRQRRRRAAKLARDPQYATRVAFAQLSAEERGRLEFPELEPS